MKIGIDPVLLEEMLDEAELAIDSAVGYVEAGAGHPEQPKYGKELYRIRNMITTPNVAVRGLLIEFEDAQLVWRLAMLNRLTAEAVYAMAGTPIDEDEFVEYGRTFGLAMPFMTLPRQLLEAIARFLKLHFELMQNAQPSQDVIAFLRAMGHEELANALQKEVSE